MVMYKVEINVAISKREDIVGEDILNILHVRKHYFAVKRRIASYLSKKIFVWGYVQIASQFLAAIAEETTKKAYIVYESLASLPKLFIENYPG